MKTLVIPNQPVLERRDIDPENASEVTSMEPVEYALKHLGYEHPTQHKKAAVSQLAGAIRGNGIRPFSASSVDQYKAQEAALRERKASAFGKMAARCFLVPKKDDKDKLEEGFLVAVPGLISVLGVVVGVITSVVAAFGGVGWFTPIVILAGSISTLAILLVCSSSAQKATSRWHWRMVPLKGYKGEVPHFALETASKIHMDAPGTEFFIEELHCEARVEDPFLVAKDPAGNMFYLEVWAEPRYKQERVY